VETETSRRAFKPAIPPTITPMLPRQRAVAVQRTG
jgi:hypothetical protein